MERALRVRPREERCPTQAEPRALWRGPCPGGKGVADQVEPIWSLLSFTPLAVLRVNVLKHSMSFRSFLHSFITCQAKEIIKHLYVLTAVAESLFQQRNLKPFCHQALGNADKNAISILLSV